MHEHENEVLEEIEDSQSIVRKRKVSFAVPEAMEISDEATVDDESSEDQDLNIAQVDMQCLKCCYTNIFPRK